ncbi:NSFL1 cofactor p47 [Pseudolycoriella hygida]|uniref:NSFL1 cofactor p47 n=1 Tax=Pseudolycoriella hygida TaxID=35572 RepID=A0A9Q0MZT2_9DIPT|nr:NSFL1 cofactor p47 [Pseudolycoriella hygida]
MSDTDRQEMIAQFCDVTGETAERAEFYLSSANWTLQLALAGFYDNDVIDPEVPFDVDEEPPVLQPTGDSFSLPARSTADDSKSKEKPTNRPRIATIHNMNRSSDDDEAQGQAFYAGGSERSGQQVLGPPPKKNPMRDYVSDVFSSAREHGAQVVDQQETATASGSSSVFVGTGYRLGQTENDHQILPDQTPRSSRKDNIDIVVLKLWRQGFSINDGDLRNYEDPANKDFLGSIMKGEIPHELRQGGSMCHVDLEDHRNEEFSKAAVKPKPFSGKGHTLGSPAPTVVSTPVTPTGSGPTISAAEAEQNANEQLNVDTNQPTTMIQVRLADGSRLSARFNHSHTVSDITSYIRTARPQYSSANFALLTTFPSKELTDNSQTIDKAGLLNASILQRLQ